MTCSDLLNLNQTPEELNRVYSTNYYWYLGSQEFRKIFLEPLAQLINNRGSVLDVACGEGWLAPLVETPYVGIDGSAVAIERARREHQKKGKEFYVDRIEAPSLSGRDFNMIVFGNILRNSIQSAKVIEFTEMYRKQYHPTHFIVYDLEDLNTGLLDSRYKIISSYHAIAKSIELEPLKRQRKILLYQCST